MPDAIAYEKLFPAVPLIGSTIAVCFDVGYFYGVGIDYFTLFSLTEHIGFALEALPAALVASVLLILLDALVQAGVNWSLKPAAQSNLPAKDRPARSVWKFPIIFTLYLLLTAAFLVHLWHDGLIRVVVLLFVFVMMVVISMIAGNRWYASGPIVLLVVGCTAALLLGEFFGARYVARPTALDTITLKSGDVFFASIIRSGERGVLYAKPQPNIVELTKWDEIKSISRNREKSVFAGEEK
jgi:hypothetical protein